MQRSCAQPEPRTFLLEAQGVGRPISMSNQPFRTSKSRYDAEGRCFVALLGMCSIFAFLGTLGGYLVEPWWATPAATDSRHHGQHTYIPLLGRNTPRVKKGIVITWCIVEPPILIVTLLVQRTIQPIVVSVPAYLAGESIATSLLVPNTSRSGILHQSFPARLQHRLENE